LPKATLPSKQLVTKANGGVSYRDFRPSSSAASKVGRANRRANTKPELLLRRALTAQGLSYQSNVRALLGAPDIVFFGTRVAVFCDGDFWHGRDWATRKGRLARGANGRYWTAKIQRNIERDREITRQLRREGWLVIRVWEGNVRSSPERVARAIMKRMSARTR